MTPLAQEADAGTQSLTIYHMWSRGAELEALEAYLDTFDQQSRGATVGHQPCANLGLEMKTSILKEQPPDFWVEWPGKNLVPYLEANVLFDTEPVWEASDIGRNLDDDLMDIVTPDGEHRPIPMTVHRVNNLFYNVELAEEAGIDPRGIDDPNELVEILDQVESDGGAMGMIQPMMNPETVLHLWETIFLGLFDVDTYDAMTDGSAERHRGEIRESLDVLASLATFATDDAAFTSFGEANERFIDGESVFIQSGDWAADMYYSKEGYEYERDWDHAAFPGTEGTYGVIMDATLAMKNGDLEEETQEFLEFAASAEAQQMFNEQKGALPPRTDADLSSFPDFLQDQYEDFQSSRAMPGTITHGLAVTPAQHIQLMTAAATFISERDPAESAEDFVAAFQA